MRLADPRLLRTRCYLDGCWLAADDGRSFAVSDPASGGKLTEVPLMTAAETARAIAAAAAALPAWQAKTAKERAAALRRWYELIVASTEDLAQLITAECGKPIAEARGEVAYGASFVEWFAEEGKRVYGESIPSPASDRPTPIAPRPAERRPGSGNKLGRRSPTARSDEISAARARIPLTGRRSLYILSGAEIPSRSKASSSCFSVACASARR